MPMMPKVSIIIVNYKSVALVTACIDSILRLTKGVSYEIIVVDNYSEDHIDRHMHTRFGDAVRCVMLDGNKGFGMANNAGFEVARGEYFFCLNPDTILLNDAVSVMAQALDNHPDIGVCGGNLFDANDQPAFSFYRVLPGLRCSIYDLTGQRLPKLVYRGNSSFNYTSQTLDVAYVTGADLMLRADLARTMGGFADVFFMYYEETDLCARIARQGWRIVSLPDARIMHLEGASFQNEAANRRRYRIIEQSRAIYMQRHMSPLKRRVCHAIDTLTIRFYRFMLRRQGSDYYKTYEARLEARRSLAKGSSV